MKAIIFDLGNVLIYFDAKRSAQRFAREAKVPVQKVWAHFFTSKTEKAYTRGEITTAEFYRHAKEAFHSKIKFGSFCDLWNNIFWENRGMHNLLKKLSRRYKLYLISNTNSLHFNYVRRCFPHLLQHFDKTFPSHLVGFRKPDPRIFRKVLKTVKIRPEEAVFIDDVPDFVEAARKIGIHGIQFRSNLQLKKDLKRLGIQF